MTIKVKKIKRMEKLQKNQRKNRRNKVANKKKEDLKQQKIHMFLLRSLQPKVEH